MHAAKDLVGLRIRCQFCQYHNTMASVVIGTYSVGDMPRFPRVCPSGQALQIFLLLAYTGHQGRLRLRLSNIYILYYDVVTCTGAQHDRNIDVGYRFKVI